MPGVSSPWLRPGVSTTKVLMKCRGDPRGRPELYHSGTRHSTIRVLSTISLYTYYPAPYQEKQMKRTLFTEEHHLFRDAFKHFLEKEVVPYYEQWEKDGIVSREM